MRFFRKKHKEPIKKEEPAIKKNRVRIQNILDGSFLEKESITKNTFFFVFLSVLTMLYISNGFHAERLVRQETKLQQKNKELRAKQISMTFELMNTTQQSQVIERLKEQDLNLQEATKPPYIIEIN